MMRSGNPALLGDVFTGVRAADRSDAMTIQGTVNKSFVLFFVLMIGAAFVWRNPAVMVPYLWPALIGGFVLALVTIFKKEWAPVTAPLYAFAEGLLLGCISSVFEKMYPGIVAPAVGLTFGVLFSMLFAYKTKMIRVTGNFRLGVFAATGGIALFYLAAMVLGFFGVNVPLINQGGIIGIGFSVFVVIIASLNLVIDFDYIQKGAEAGAPRCMEWYGAFSLMVTLIWLYLEILRLLAKMQRR
jgi:uncharacterized YccA/Bax inhibitor family protein